MKTSEILMLLSLTFAIDISEAAGQDLTHEQFAQLGNAEQVKYLRDSVERFQAVTQGKMIDAAYSIQDRTKIPLNYGTASPTEGLRWGIAHRQIDFHVRYDGKFGWHKTVSKSKAPLENYIEEGGQNGSKVVTLRRNAGDGKWLAVINCNDDFLVNLIPDSVWTRPFRLLYFGLEHESSATFLVDVLDNATEVETDLQFSGQKAVAVIASGRPGIDRIYFAIEPATHCIGIERQESIPTSADEDKVVFRIEYRYVQSKEVSSLKQATSSVLFIKPNGDVNVDSYSEFTIDRLRFRQPLPPDDYLPKIPAGMNVRDNCASKPIESVAGDAVEPTKNYVWLYFLVGLLAIGGVGGVVMWRRNRG